MDGDTREIYPPASPALGCATLAEVLVHRAGERPEGLAFRFLEEGEVDGRVSAWSWGELKRRADSIAAALAEHAAPGQRALLLFAPGLDFIAAFFGCLIAGVVAVPVPPPDPRRLDATLPRLLGVVADADPCVVLTTTAIAGFGRALGGAFAALPWIEVDAVWPAAAPAVAVAPDDLAFLQYTSGSTGDPRGVMVSHRNLLANLAMSDRGYELAGREGQVVSWLPFYHDMGLIGVVLGNAYQGSVATLFSPLDFLKRPLRWLEAISRYGVPAMSGAPDFAYAYVARRATPAEIRALDLSRWVLAFCGAEPVQASTLDRFAETFAPAGFRRDAFRPSYGLAEATLFVSATAGEPRILAVDGAALQRGVVRPGDRPQVSCGRPDPEERVRIVAPESGAPVPDGVVGEILIAGDHVVDGYWRQPEHPSFAARLDDGDGPYLRSGDLGFLHGGELFISGRLKDLIIVRGRNLFPNDLEAACDGIHPAIRSGGVAAFGFDRGDGEGGRIAALIEVKLEGASADEVSARVREAIAAGFGVQVDAVLVPPRTIPRTTSGKIRRSELRSRWLAGEVTVLAESRAAPVADSEPPAPPRHTRKELVAWITAWIQERVRPGPLRPSESFTSAGLDSLNLVWLASDLEKLLGFDIPVETLFGGSIKTTAALLAMGERKLGSTRRIDLAAEARLDPAIAPIASAPPRAADAPLLITGATGFVGAYLVAALLRRSSAPLLCLARAADDDEARARVLHALARFDLDERALARVRGLAGDLARPGLGLDEARLAALAGEVAAIYHCAAEIDWVKPYSSLRPVNVDGTRAILRLACAGGAALHYVSTIGVYPLGEDVATPFAEDAPLGESDKLQLGYSQSKWVAEKLVEEARARGLPVTVYRPGLVSGERRSGYERDPEHQLLYAFIAGCVAFGQAPALEKVIDASPVDWVAEAIAALSLLPEARGRRLNLINRAPIRQRELYAALRARGYVVDEIAYPRWRDRVLALEPGTSNPLARFIAFYKMMDEARMRRVEVQMRERLPIEDGDARALLGRVDLPSPPLDRRLVDTYLGYYVGQGLLPRPAAPPSAAPAPSSVLDRQRPPEIAFPDLFLPRSPKLEGFYERATERQWRARSRIDWSTPLDPHNPADLPDVALPIYGSPIFERLSAAERGRVRAHYQAWQLSQFLYGEQIALVATSQLIRLAPSAEVQLFAGTQAADEARHLEIYTRLIDEKIGLRYPMVGPLSRLADVVFADDRWDITSLGIQILVEGLALASFAAMRDQSRNPLIVAVHTYVMEDEARHVGFGNRLLAPYYAELSDGERAEREELVIEASYLLRDRILATDEIWERCGLPPRECADWIRESGFQRAWGAALFSRIVPAIRAIGLWSTRVQDAYGKMGLLGHACRDLDDLRVEDERRADALDGRAGGEERARA